MLSQFLLPPYLPFAFSFVLMAGIGMIEAVGLGLGHLDLDGDLDADGGGGFLDWLGLGGELPILIWLTSLLGCFTVVGIAIQQVATAIHGAPMSWMAASFAGVLLGVPLNTLAANVLARILPRYETSVVSKDDLLRRRGIVLEGAARRGFPARAKVVDQHGQAHFVMIEPHDDAETIPSGETALLVRREGQIFYALPNRSTVLQPL